MQEQGQPLLAINRYAMQAGRLTGHQVIAGLPLERRRGSSRAPLRLSGVVQTSACATLLRPGDCYTHFVWSVEPGHVHGTTLRDARPVVSGD
jgi:hypothetical protein